MLSLSSSDLALLELFKDHGYVADPHGAVGYLGAKKYLETHNDDHVVFLETAHPTKFLDVVEEVIKEKQELPKQIQSVMDGKKVSIKIKEYSQLKAFLLNHEL